MTTAYARIALILAALALGLASVSERASAEAPAGFSQAELDQMLAPIALYPDTVLSHVLIAATYPLEVVQAARWSRANPGLSGEYAVAAVEHQPWDPSVMALVAFPELLARMDADLGWTQRLGDAFLIQEYQVLDTVQYLRDEAYASGHLRSNEYVRVVRETEYIYIEPSVTRVVYVPWYDPYVVYGNWRWSAYPPVYWHQPRGYRSGFSFHWSSGHHLEYGFFFSAVHWPSHRLVVHDHHGHYKRHDKRYGRHGYDGPRFASGRDLAHHESARHWTHDPDHRRGVAYRRGIDERHVLRASDDSRKLAGSHGRGTSRNYDNGGRRGDRIAERRDSRRELLRERSHGSQFLSQRSASPAVDSGRRNRHASDRTVNSRNSLRRASDSILRAARKQPTTSGRRESAGRKDSVSPQRRGNNQRRATPAPASTRQELAQRRASSVKSGSRSRDTDALRARAAPSSSRAVPRASSQPSSKAPARATSRAKSLQRSSRDARTTSPRTRAPADTRRTISRSSRPATSGTSPPRAARSPRQVGESARSVSAESRRQPRSNGRGSRAETLRSRGRDGRQ